MKAFNRHDNIKNLQDNLNSFLIYPQDENWSPEIIESLINEIKSELILYAFPSAVLSYLDMKNRIMELLSINPYALIRYLEKSYLLSFRTLDFISDLPQNLRGIEKRNDEVLISNTQVSGKIDWIHTMKENNYFPRGISTLCIHSNEKSYDTPANRALKDCINSLFDITTNIIQYFRLSNVSSTSWQPIVFDVYTILKNSLKYLNHRIPEKKVTSRDYTKAFEHKKNLYREIAKIGYEVQNLENSDFLMKSWPDFFHTIPENLDKLFEVYVLLKIIQSISIDLNTQPTLFLQRSGGNPFIASFLFNEIQLFIFYQRVPFKSSLYLKTLKRHGLTLRKRIPDICIQIIKPESKKNIIIEVKRTKNLKYLRSSIYKTFAYLADYSEEENLHPYLVVWDLPDINDILIDNSYYLPIFCYKNLPELINSIINLIEHQD